MRRNGVLASLVSTALLLVVTSGAAAQTFDGTVVANTLHNLRQSTGSPMPVADLGEICVYCHTPHGGTTTAPLWNRTDPTGPYTMYFSTTIDMPIGGAPTGTSLACLSCHDGTIGVDEVINYPLAFDPADAVGGTITNCAGCHQGSNPPGGFDFSNTLMGTDLSDDHPISLTYTPSADPGKFQPAGSVEGAGLPLPDGEVQCASCHNPHSAQWRPFLRMDNADSAMCLTCHII